MQTLRDRVLESLCEMSDLPELNDEMTMEGIGFDSMDLVEVAMEMEDLFKLREIEDHEITMSTTVGQLVELVEKRVYGRPC